MKLRVVFFISFYLGAGFLVGSCSSKEATSESLQTEASRLIDQGEVGEAIVFLSDEIKRRDEAQQPLGDHSPETESLRITLVSAYFKLAGLEMKDILRAVAEGNRINSYKMVTAVRDPNADQSLGIQLDFLSNHLLHYYKTFQWMSALPLLGSERLAILTYGLKILNTVQFKKPEDHLYSAIIKTIVLNSSLTPQAFERVLPKFSKSGEICTARIDDFKIYLVGLSEEIEGILSDLLVAMPEKQADLIPGMEATRSAKGEILAMTQNALVVDTLNIAIDVTNLIQVFGGRFDFEKCSISFPSK